MSSKFTNGYEKLLKTKIGYDDYLSLRRTEGPDAKEILLIQRFAINITHPFGLPIWKTALYKKLRSVTRNANSALHSTPSKSEKEREKGKGKERENKGKGKERGNKGKGKRENGRRARSPPTPHSQPTYLKEDVK
ncbi:calcium/proton exchanger [Rhizophagus irregularis DAOM 181602=DAOM 197198]|uniref:Uncharacterized protein n=1 Tax=Rhizophagus irregularis (strain DAOM 181602 / DAOM 197198 / MUCL 43194) TaxID=747089 RepID=U9UXG9_RHIID|nr:calcium/proton exchanger [Rhizophagus irregularis DAOM 181602=DAOM 197198]